jgi:glycosyltransferase involved in cell wall biosynthesis
MSSGGYVKYILSKVIISYKNRTKNILINKNIRKFIETFSVRASVARESEFFPEVLIPCYNHGVYVATALSSIPKGLPITIIDDASSDNTNVILESLRSSYRFKLITNEINLGQEGSLNKAIIESANNLFVVLNADDYLLKFSIPTVLALFNEYPTIRMAGGGSIAFLRDEALNFNKSMPDELGYVPLPVLYGPKQANEYKSLNDINLTMSSCTFLRSAWEAVDGYWPFEKRVCSFDDRDFEMRVSALFDVAVIGEPLCFYRLTSSLGRAQYTG